MMIYRLCILFILLLSGCRADAAVPALPSQASATALPASRQGAVRRLTSTPEIPTPAATATPVVTQPAPTVPAPAATPTETAVPPPAPTRTPAPTPVAPAFSYPIGSANLPAGEGFFMRHGFMSENTWYNPGYWHTGEDWYAIEGDTAGARVYAVATGDVVYVGSNYPGRVVIVRHAEDLYSMYGHLDPAVAVAVGQTVERGTLLGTVLRRTDRVPNHLHFEIRTFLTTPAVNGPDPRYGFRCGPNCPPGPGYWPIDAPDLPVDQGWRNPTHVINARMFPPDVGARLGDVVVAPQPVVQSHTLWSAPPGAPRAVVGTQSLESGQRFPLLAVHAGAGNVRGSSAEAYQLWYHIELPDGRRVWLQVALPSAFETGGDGRPASIFLSLVPAVPVAPTSAAASPDSSGGP